ncbi:MAG: branched-chain amino acid ABC transporter permease [Eubacterium sp.]|nr:branched-chain amino acid ABC transporter permease [Eubacterium sp.]
MNNSTIKRFGKQNLVPLIVVILAILLPVVVTNAYLMRVFIMMLCYMIIAMSINLIVGYCGQLDFGRSAFVGLGAYFSAIVSMRLGVPFIISFIGAGVFAGLVGAALGMVCRKSTFDYLTLMTMGFNEICRLIFINCDKLTGGALGIKKVPKPNLGFIVLDTPRKYYYFVLIFVVLTFVIIRNIIGSKYGRAFMAIRDDATATLYMGIDVAGYKVFNFAVASVFSGIAGALMAHYTGYVSPASYTLDESILMLQMPILGGLGSLPGSIVGTIILQVLPEISRTFYQYRLMFIGVLMVVLMGLAPNGLLGKGGIVDKIRFAVMKKQSRDEGSKAVEK